MSEVIRPESDPLVVGLRSAEVELHVVPSVGAKLVRLYDRRTKRDWMWAPEPARELAPVPPGSAFDDSQLIGMDECLPTVAPCTLGGQQLPDHGEVWNVPWQLDEAALDDGCLMTSVTLKQLPLQLQRSIVLEQDRVRFGYRLENRSDATIPYLWAMHPLFRMRPDDRLEVGDVAAKARVDSASGLAGLAADDWVDWAAPAEGIQTQDLLSGHANASLKLYVPTSEAAWFTLRNGTDGTRLDGWYGPPDLLPGMGLWISRGGWNGFEHVALEPTNGLSDRLDQAGDDPALILPARAVRTWWVEWKLG